jgi:transcriptional regulator with PAS, ATPase and Fis domain
VVIACAAIPPTLVESELFGYHKGAFTGAVRTTLGKLEIANKGTVFLDDIDTLDITMQAKLLRVIQEKEFERLGTTKVIKLDVRFLAASNKDLSQLIQTGGFREDLFYRLNVLPIEIPPLRQRKKDIPLLIEHFLRINAKRSAIKALMEYDWPGNVRELQNLVERCFTISRDSVMQLQDISILSVAKPKIKDMNLKDAVDAFEQQYIGEVLEGVDGNRTQAALILGVHRNTLLSKLGASAQKKEK